MRDDQINEFILRNHRTVSEWAEKVEKECEDVKLPYTDQDYDRMYKNIMKKIEEKERLKRIFGY